MAPPEKGNEDPVSSKDSPEADVTKGGLGPYIVRCLAIFTQHY